MLCPIASGWQDRLNWTEAKIEQHRQQFSWRQNSLSCNTPKLDRTRFIAYSQQRSIWTEGQRNDFAAAFQFGKLSPRPDIDQDNRGCACGSEDTSVGAKGNFDQIDG